MSINTTDLINVLNYNMNPVTIKTHVKEYICNSAKNEESPSINPLSVSEVQFLDSNTNAFKIGLLRFPKENEKEIYEDILRNPDWENILTNEQIKEIILHPSVEKLSKIVEIENVSLFERVRGVFFLLKNSNQHDISNRVEAIILRRHRELCNQQVKSSIVLSSKNTVKDIPNEDVIALKEQNKSMQEQTESMRLQMENMQKMMEQMLAMQAVQPVKETVKEKQVSKPVEIKKPVPKQTTKSSK